VNASVFLKGDVIASPIGSRTLLFPFPELHFPAGTAAALARLSIYATARLKVQKLLCSLGRAQECRTIAWKCVSIILSPRLKFLHCRCNRTSRASSLLQKITSLHFIINLNKYILISLPRYKKIFRHPNIFIRFATFCNTTKEWLDRTRLLLPLN